MTGMPAGACRNCNEAVSYFARSCPSCGAPNQPNAVTMLVALVLVVLLPLAALFGPKFFSRNSPKESPEASTTGPNTSTERKPEPYEWIVQAMAECDAYAKQNADTLYFLIVPV